MKLRHITFILALAGAVTFFSCQATAQQSNVYKNVNYTIGNFNSISSNTIANIIVKQDNATALRVEGNERLINNLKIYVKNNILYINMKDERMHNRNFLKRNNKLSIYVTTPQLRSLSRAGVGNISLEGTFNAPNLTIKNEGVGNITSENLVANTLNVTSEGVGNITLKGRTNNLTIDNQSVGNVNAEGMIAKNAKVSSDGVGNVHFYASESMDVESDGVGNVTYYGNPKVKNIEKDGVGRVKAGN